MLPVMARLVNFRDARSWISGSEYFKERVPRGKRRAVVVDNLELEDGLWASGGVVPERGPEAVQRTMLRHILPNQEAGGGPRVVLGTDQGASSGTDGMEALDGHVDGCRRELVGRERLQENLHDQVVGNVELFQWT